MAEVTIAVHAAAEAAAFRDEVAAIWEDAFDPIPDLRQWRETVFDRHRGRDRYRLAIATHRGRDIGFAWGYIGQRGQFWSDRVLERLGEVAEPWVGGLVEFVELAVLQAFRAAGTGGRLHDALLNSLPSRPALLGTTRDAEDPAVRLYRSRGWRTLGRLDPDSQVMVRPPGPGSDHNGSTRHSRRRKGRS